jgi:hypothetical protein
MDNILSFLTSNKNIDLIPNKIPSRDVFLQTETYNKFTGGAEYNKDTYIGHLKLKNGGMKIVKGGDDDHIKKERNIVLEHLHKSLNGGKIDADNLPTYYKALEGGYIRNLICPTDSKTCSNFIDNNKMAAYKLSKNALKNGYSNTLKTFKQNAPKLYKNLKDSDFIKKLKYKRDKYTNRLSDGGSAKSDDSLSENLSNLRNNVGTRNLNETGGLSNADSVIRNRKSDIFYELQALRDNKGKVKQLAKPLGGYKLNETGGYQKYSDEEGLKEQGEFGNATLAKLIKARYNELDNYRIMLEGNTSNLSSPAPSPAPSPASSPASSPQISPQASFRLPPLRLSNSSNKRKLLMSRKISPTISRHIVNQSGGDALYKLRMELGRL